MKEIKKWVAGFNGDGSIVLEQVTFRQTPKLLLLETDDSSWGRITDVLRHTRHLKPSDGRLHDTREAALDYQVLLQENAIRAAKREIAFAEKLLAKLQTMRGESTTPPAGDL